MEKKANRDIVGVVAYAIIIAVFFFVEPVAPITNVGMKVLGVFIAAIVGWALTSNAVWVSMATLVLFPFTGVATYSQVIATTFGNDLFVFAMFIFAFTGYLTISGAASTLALRLINANFAKKNPWLLLFILLFATWLLAAFTKTAGAILLMWSIVYAMCKELDEKPFGTFSNVLVFGVAAIGAVGMGSIPWKSTSLINLGIYTKATGLSVNYVEFFLYSLPVMLLSIVGYLLLARFVFKFDVSRMRSFEVSSENASDLVFTPEKKIALGSLIVLCVLFLLPSILPAGNIISTTIDSLGMALVAIAIFAVLSLIRVDGKSVFSFPEVAKTLPWGILIMIACIMAFLSYLGDASTGINAFLTGVVGGLFANATPIVFLLAIGIVCVILTNLMTNVVVGMILMQAFVPAAMAMGIDPIYVAYIISGTCVIALLLPNSGAASIVLFANNEWMKMKDIYKLGIPTVVLFTLIAVLWGFAMMVL